MLTKTYLAALAEQYTEFTQGRQHPKLQQLNAWGKQRYFLAKYFDVVEESYERQQIVLRHQQHYVELNLAEAPDFMEKTAYLSWLRQQLEASTLV
jgi:hypothetical protein